MTTVLGNDKNNWLIGSNDADTIKGYGGDDWLKGGGGADYIDGGTGIDTVMYTDSPEGVFVDLYHGSGSHGFAEGDRLYGIENVWGSSYGDTLAGTDGANELSGLDGVDSLYGYRGNDVLDGGYGDDYLEGGAGADSLNGGAGIDTAIYATSPAGVTAILISNTGLRGHAEGDTFTAIENLHGSYYDDYLAGDNNDNALFGNDGPDVLLGYDGADWVGGGRGSDNLAGMNGDDQLYGHEGQDLLYGGMGRDLLSGGAEADFFIWHSTEETGNTPGTADVILDFNFAEGDRISLEAVDANLYAAGDQAFRFIGTAAFSGRPGEINYYQLNGDTYIQMQTGTSPDVEGVIRIAGLHTPEASWFVL